MGVGGEGAVILTLSGAKQKDLLSVARSLATLGMTAR